MSKSLNPSKKSKRLNPSKSFNPLGLTLKVPKTSTLILTDKDKLGFTNNTIKDLDKLFKNTSASFLDNNYKKIIKNLKGVNYELSYYILGMFYDRLCIYVNELKINHEQQYLTNKFFYSSTGTSRNDKKIKNYFFLASGFSNIVSKPDDKIRNDIIAQFGDIVNFFNGKNKEEIIYKLQNDFLRKFPIHQYLEYGRLLNETNTIISYILKSFFDKNKDKNYPDISDTFITEFNIYKFITENNLELKTISSTLKGGKVNKQKIKTKNKKKNKNKNKNKNKKTKKRIKNYI
jgi:hypothetical protein